MGLPEVQVQCPGCGSVEVQAEHLECEIEPGEALMGICELVCPSCSWILLVPATAEEIRTLWGNGARYLWGATPFELLEPRYGLPISWDEVLDFVLSLEDLCPSQSAAGPDGVT